MLTRFAMQEYHDADARVREMLAQEAARAHTAEEIEEDDAATLLQAAWRTHMACKLANRLRYQGASKLKRTFSWSKRGAAGKGSPLVKQKSASSFGAGARAAGTPTRGGAIKRSLSFDKLRSSAWSSKPKEVPEGAPKPPAVSKQLLFILLHRGPTGLGLELDATNTVVNIVPGGAADKQGYFLVGDTIASVDGVPLRGRLLQEVMDRSKSSYSFDVWRLAQVPVETPKPKPNAVRRAFSFDRFDRKGAASPKTGGTR